MIWKAAERYSVDYALVKAVIKAESNFNPQAISRAGARGLMQLMPGTASDLGVKNSFHPEDNIQGGVRYLRYLLDLFGGNLHLALAAYNAGGNVILRHNGIPPYKETQTYVRRVLRHFQGYPRQVQKSRISAPPRMIKGNSGKKREIPVKFSPLIGTKFGHALGPEGRRFK